MPTRTKISSIAVGCLLVGMCAGVVGAQVVERATRARYLASGLFSVGAGENAQFHVTLDDSRAGAPARVLVQFLDDEGAVVARNEVVLRSPPGRSSPPSSVQGSCSPPRARSCGVDGGPPPIAD